MRHLEIKYEIKSDLASDNLGGQIIQGAVHILRNTGWGGVSPIYYNITRGGGVSPIYYNII